MRGPTASDLYFAHLEVLRAAERLHDVKTLIEHSRLSIPWIPAMNREMAIECGHPPLRWPALEHLNRFLPLFLCDDELMSMRTVVSGHETLSPALSDVEGAITRLCGARATMARIEQAPGCLQSSLHSAVPSASDVLYWWDRFRFVRRERSGRSFRVWIISRPDPTRILDLQPLLDAKTALSLFDQSMAISRSDVRSGVAIRRRTQ